MGMFNYVRPIPEWLKCPVCGEPATEVQTKDDSRVGRLRMDDVTMESVDYFGVRCDNVSHWTHMRRVRPISRLDSAVDWKVGS